MKRFLLLLGIFLMIISIITACGEKTGTEPDTQSEAVPSANENAPAPTSPSLPAQGDEDSIAELFAKARGLEMQYDYTIVSPEGEISGKQWIKGKNLRMEMKAEGMEGITIINYDEGVVYNIDPVEKMAVKMVLDEEMAALFTNPTDYYEDEDVEDSGTLEIIETTTYEGLKCKVIFSKDADGSESKIWVSEKYGMPLRIEEIDAYGNKTVTEFKNLKVGSVPDDIFNLPQGIEVMDISN